MSLGTLRALLGIVGGVGAGAAVAGIIYGGPTMIGVGVAVAAACVIGIGLIRAIQSDRQRHRRYREDVWQRRIKSGPPARYSIERNIGRTSGS